MTQEQINRLAAVYADKRVPERKTYDDDAMWDEKFVNALRLLEAIADDYLIVEKSKVRLLNSTADRIYDTHPYDDYRRCECMGYMQALKDVFPTFNPTEK